MSTITPGHYLLTFSISGPCKQWLRHLGHSKNLMIDLIIDISQHCETDKRTWLMLSRCGVATGGRGGAKGGSPPTVSKLDHEIVANSMRKYSGCITRWFCRHIRMLLMQCPPTSDTWRRHCFHAFTKSATDRLCKVSTCTFFHHQTSGRYSDCTVPVEGPLVHFHSSRCTAASSHPYSIHQVFTNNISRNKSQCNLKLQSERNIRDFWRITRYVTKIV